MSKENCYLTTKRTQRPLKFLRDRNFNGLCELLFNNEENAKTIEIPISEEDSYEKNVVMYVVIGEPRHIAGPPGEGEGVDYAALDAKGEENWTEDERISTLGRPRLGDVTKI